MFARCTLAFHSFTHTRPLDPDPDPKLFVACQTNHVLNWKIHSRVSAVLLRQEAASCKLEPSVYGQDETSRGLGAASCGLAAAHSQLR
eukprot:6197250-Pleurochrysis_carterae.AAC.2